VCSGNRPAARPRGCRRDHSAQPVRKNENSAKQCRRRRLTPRRARPSSTCARDAAVFLVARIKEHGTHHVYRRLFKQWRTLRRHIPRRVAHARWPRRGQNVFSKLRRRESHMPACSNGPSLWDNSPCRTPCRLRQSPRLTIRHLSRSPRSFCPARRVRLPPMPALRRILASRRFLHRS